MNRAPRTECGGAVGQWRVWGAALLEEPIARRRRLADQRPTLSARVLRAASIALVLACVSTAWASSATESPDARSRDIEKAQRTKLRWRSTRATTETASEPLASKQAARGEVARRDVQQSKALSRAERHRRSEAAMVRQTSATKPLDDPFADPFFDDKPAKAKLKVEPIVSQPMNRPPDEDGAVPTAPVPEGVMPEPPEGLESAEQPEGPDQESKMDEFAQAPQGELPPCPAPSDTKKIREVTTDISAQAGEFPPECSLGNQPYEPRNFTPICYMYKASGLCSKPLYFQDVALERYGHSWGPVLQPFVSGARFYTAFAIWPYLMGVYPPTECQYALGYYRPSTCAPKMLYPFPVSLRGGLIETGFVFGAIALLP